MSGFMDWLDGINLPLLVVSVSFALVLVKLIEWQWRKDLYGMATMLGETMNRTRGTNYPDDATVYIVWRKEDASVWAKKNPSALWLPSNMKGYGLSVREAVRDLETKVFDA